MEHLFLKYIRPLAWWVIYLMVVVISACSSSKTKLQTNNQNLKKNSLERDMVEMLSWFNGRFDNFMQAYDEKEKKAKFPHEHIHSIFYKVNLPSIGQNVFYVKQYMDGNPNKIYRQRLYHFFPNKVENAVQLDIYSFPVDSLYYDAHLYQEKLAGLTLDKLQATKGCEVYWKKQGDTFIGYMKPKACSVVSKRSGKRIYITDSLQLTKEEIWIRDEAEDEDGNYVFGHKEKIPHKLRKCRFFTGWIIAQKEGKDNEYHQMRNITIHDQGQRIQLVTETGEKTKYYAELSEVAYNKDLNVLKLAIYEEGKDKAIAYTWANTDAERIGINLRYVQAGFTLVKGQIF
ncbi:MAG: chromophore lyase CpcT/CpeT [Thermoflexibacter sp.]|jgi:hypothetical protein|nr:chromophore lyase CpcT/CpeT [Thermoflexibacter sp.]